MGIRQITRTEWGEEHDSCFHPGCAARYRYTMETHEILGGADRAFTSQHPFYWIRLCRPHHAAISSRPSPGMLIAELAWKKLHDEEWYDPERVIRLWRSKCTDEYVKELLEAIETEYQRIK